MRPSLEKCPCFVLLSCKTGISALFTRTQSSTSSFNYKKKAVSIPKNIRKSTSNDAKANEMSLENRTVNVSEIKRTLRSHGLQVKEGYACLETSPINFCLDEQRSKKSPTCKVFMNKFTGYFECPSCEMSGSWNSLEQILSLKKSGHKLSFEGIKSLGIVRNSEAPNEVRERISGAVSLSSVLSDSSSPLFLAVQHLLVELELERVKWLSSLRQLGTLVSTDGSTLLFPLRTHPLGSVRGLKVLSPPILGDSGQQEVTIPATGCQGMFGWTKSGAAKGEAVIVASVKDALAIASAIPSVQALCLPHGSSCLPQGLLPFLEPFSKITLWFGRNVSGLWDDPRMHARKLGEERCYFVRPTESHPGAWEGMLSGMALSKLMGEARMVAHPSITTFESLKEDILAEIQNVEKVKGVKWRRFPSLNRILQGHRRGELTILTGPTGSGKTTFMSEYSLDLCLQGVSTLWGSFEIRNTRLARSMLQQLSGEPLEGKGEEAFEHWAEKFALLPLYFMTFHGQQSLSIVMETVSHAAYVHDIAHVVIDNVQFMLGMGEAESIVGWGGPRTGISDRFWRQDLVIAAFRRFATAADCHVTLVIHPRKERESEDLTSNSIFGGVKASQEADNILIIQDKRLSSVRGKKYLQVAKNRYSGDLGVMALEFDKEGLSYGKRWKKSEETGGNDATIAVESENKAESVDLG